jgi:hypothetical protein
MAVCPFLSGACVSKTGAVRQTFCLRCQSSNKLEQTHPKRSSFLPRQKSVVSFSAYFFLDCPAKYFPPCTPLIQRRGCDTKIKFSRKLDTEFIAMGKRKRSEPTSPRQTGTETRKLTKMKTESPDPRFGTPGPSAAENSDTPHVVKFSEDEWDLILSQSSIPSALLFHIYFWVYQLGPIQAIAKRDNGFLTTH